MHQQYISTRDVKFPDCKQYTKPGDVLMFNNVSNSLSIYRCDDLIGTVQFSASGLQEFLRLGWIIKPTESKTTEVEKRKKAPEAKKKAVEALPAAPKATTQSVVLEEVVEEPIQDSEPIVTELSEPEIQQIPSVMAKSGSLSEERVIEAFEHKPRKPKKS